MADTFTDTITKLKSEIEGHVATIKGEPAWAQIEKLYKALGTIEELANVERTSLVDLFSIEDSTGKRLGVKVGEFYGLEALDAAKRVLKRKGEALSLDEIMKWISIGGVQADKATLRTSLSRSTWDVAKVGEDLYGLLEFYPHVKRGGKGKKAAATANGENATPAATAEVTADEPTGT